MATDDPQSRPESEAEKSIQDGILKRIVNHMRENGYPDFEATDIAKIEPVEGGNSGPEIMIFGHNKDQMTPIIVEELFSADELHALNKSGLDLKNEALRQNAEAAVNAPLPKKEPETEGDDAPDNDLDKPDPEAKVERPINLPSFMQPGAKTMDERAAEHQAQKTDADQPKSGWRSWLSKLNPKNWGNKTNKDDQRIDPQPLDMDRVEIEDDPNEPVLRATRTAPEPNFTLVDEPKLSPQAKRTSRSGNLNHPDDVTYRGDLNGGRVNFARRSLRTIARHINIDPKKIQSVAPVYHNGEIVPGDVEIQPKRRGLFSLFRKGEPTVRHFSEDRLLPENVQKMIYLANGYAQGRYGKAAEPAPAKAPKAKKPKGEGWWSRFKRSWNERSAAAKARQNQARVQGALNAAETRTNAADGDNTAPETPEARTSATPEPTVSTATAGVPPSEPPQPPTGDNPAGNGNGDDITPPTPPKGPTGENQNGGDYITPPEDGSPEDGNNAGEPPKPPQQPPAANNTEAAAPPPAASPIIEDAQKRKSLTKIADDVFKITFAENRQGIDLHDVQKAYANDNGDLVLSLNDPNAQPRVVSAEALAKLGTASVIALDLNALKAHRHAVSARHPASPDHIAANFNPANDDKPPTETYGPPAPTRNGGGNDQKTIFDQLAQDMTRNAAGQKGGRITADSKYGEAFATAILGQEAPEFKLHDIKGVTSDGISNLILELKDGELRDLPIDIAETHFQDTRDLALAMNLAKQKDNRQASELFLSDLKNGGSKMGPAIEELESASVNKKGKLVLRLKDGTKRHYGVKTKIKKSRFDSAEDLADSVNAAIYNEEWAQRRESEAHLEASNG